MFQYYIAPCTGTACFNHVITIIPVPPNAATEPQLRLMQFSVISTKIIHQNGDGFLFSFERILEKLLNIDMQLTN